MGDTINMAAYARMLCGLAPIPTQELVIKPETGDNCPPYNAEKPATIGSPAPAVDESSRIAA